MSKYLKTMYLYLLVYGWYVHSQWTEPDTQEVVFVLAPPGPTAHSFRVRLTPAGE